MSHLTRWMRALAGCVTTSPACKASGAWRAVATAPLPVDDVVDPTSRPRVLEDLTRVVATCMPHYGRYGMPFPGRGFIDSERVFYPLSADERMVDCILELHR